MKRRRLLLASLLLALGPRVNRLIGLRWLARILYPDAFPEDPRPIVRDFYTRCYHQTPSEAQLDQLLRPSVPAT